MLSAIMLSAIILRDIMVIVMVSLNTLENPYTLVQSDQIRDLITRDRIHKHFILFVTYK